MSMSVTELAELPTAPTVSRVLTEAATYADQRAHLALRRAVYGATDFGSFAATLTTEHAIAEGVALIVIASLIDPEQTNAELPTPAWTAGRFSQAVKHAHQIIGAWAETRTAQQLAHLFEAAADRATQAE